ncbi:MAG: methionyl-tRNA formyltransferase [Lachnospiraceae bacterium]|nr:methionyl-tRNA formyltransferase [Lachnospiraceae bacterium]
MKIVYMGTPDFAVGPLEALIAAGHEIVLVVTQPDRAKGRSDKLIPSPVKAVAMEHNIPVLTPERIKRPEEVEKLRAYPADIFVVAAFGQILSQEILDMPRYGCVNIHASLLPKYRGAAPIQWSILDGDKKTGVTIMQMDAGLDTGDILFVEETQIGKEETGGELFDRLAEIGSNLIVEALSEIEKGNVHPIKQDDTKSTYAKMLTKETGAIDWAEPAEKIERYVRGLNPWPGCYTSLDGAQLKIWKSRVATEEECAQLPKGAQCGAVVKTTKKEIFVACSVGVLVISELQIAGKKRMAAADFLAGRKIADGTVLGA